MINTKQTIIESPVVVPDFITRETIASMNDDQLDEMLEGIRIRRMQANLIYRQHIEAKEQAAQIKVAAKIDKKVDQILRTLDSNNKSLERLERYVQELRSLRIEGGLTVI